MIKTTAQTLFILLALLLMPGHAKAEADSKLETAIHAWLDDRDDIAIPILAELARSGDENAMLLLGQVANQPGKFSPFLASLKRRQRNQLLNAKGGLSGVSWLRKVENHRGLAVALQRAHRDEVKMERLASLFKHKETGQAIYAIHRDNGGLPFFKISKEHQFPHEALHALWRNTIYFQIYDNQRQLIPKNELADMKRVLADASLSSTKHVIQRLMFSYEIFKFLKNKPLWTKSADIGKTLLHGEATAYEMKSIKVRNGALPEFKPVRIQYSGVFDPYRFAVSLLLRAQELQPLVRFCENKCPQTSKTCTIRLYSAIGGYAGLMSMQSPLEKLISRTRYFSSKRYGGDFLRRILDSDIQQVRKLTGRTDSCVKQLLAKRG